MGNNRQKMVKNGINGENLEKIEQNGEKKARIGRGVRVDMLSELTCLSGFTCACQP